MDPTEGTSAPGEGKSHRFALFAVTMLFFMWGFLTTLNDILVPHLKSVFELDYARGALVQFSFFTAYLLVSLPAGWVVDKVGYKRGIVIGLGVAGAGALLFYPAASVPSFLLFLAAIFVLASGITALQVAANPYVAELGPKATASSRLTLTQAFNSLGTTIAPFFGGFLFLGGAVGQGRLAEAHAVRIPYVGLALALFALAAVVAVLRLPRVEEEAQGEQEKRSLWSVIRIRHVGLGAGAIFLYVGAEVAIGSFLVSFLELPSIAAMDGVTAARHVSYYWGGAMVGRFAGSAVLRRVDPGRVLAAHAAFATALIALTVLSSGHVAMWAALATGLCNSIMFPTIFTLGIAGLGPLTSRGSSLLIMSIVGGAVVPVIFGALADRVGLHPAFALLSICYLYIVHYGLRGSRPRAGLSKGST